MIYFKKKLILLLFFVPIISFIGGIWHGQFINDGYHWGFIFSNALDLLDGKKPFEEIFIQYGLGTTLIHSFVLFLFDKNHCCFTYFLIVKQWIPSSFVIWLIQQTTYQKYIERFMTSRIWVSIFSSCLQYIQFKG